MPELNNSAAEAEIRFLDQRLEVIRAWPPSERKRANMEAISRRLAEIGRSALGRPEVADLLALSCALLDNVFAEPQEAAEKCNL